ncbi:MAG: ABC transporter permease [Romboutsia timonensis]
MNIAWKEMKKNKARFLILGFVVFLISFLTFIISGMANGLSQDNASLIKNLPDGNFYMAKDAEQKYNFSNINQTTQDTMLSKQKDAVALSIQMGTLNDMEGKLQSVAFVTATNSEIFPHVNKGEVILDVSMKEKGIKVGDKLTNNQYSGEFVVKGFVDKSKFNHASVAFINMKDYKEIYRMDELQLIYTPEKGASQEVTADDLQSFSNTEFLNTISSYKTEQQTLNMIIWFLVGISGMLFAIFFYMMNVQKIGLYGILKAMGIKTSVLFRMMWTQMGIIIIAAMGIAIVISNLLNVYKPGMPYYLSTENTVILSVMFLIIGFIGTTLSGIQIKKVEPLQAIQRGED